MLKISLSAKLKKPSIKEIKSGLKKLAEEKKECTLLLRKKFTFWSYMFVEGIEMGISMQVECKMFDLG